MDARTAEGDMASKLRAVRERIAAAAHRSSRDPGAVRLVAVSKTKDARAIRDAYAAGQRDFGENYAQELVKKAAELADLRDLRWHFIGHLQRNKAKLVARVASVVHTVDSSRLAEELAKRAGENPILPPRAFETTGATTNGRLPVFVEVNVAGEAQKSGCRPSDLASVLGAIEPLPSLRLVGLMTVPPASDEPAASRRYFEELAALREANGGPGRLPELSMGMSHDLEEAVQAGATIVRVGTAIFGERNP
jgi:pyridoxal phosphate enzyme (YggS family)